MCNTLILSEVKQAHAGHLGHKITVASYADDIVIKGETIEDVIWTAEKLIRKGKDIRLQVNDQKNEIINNI